MFKIMIEKKKIFPVETLCNTRRGCGSCLFTNDSLCIEVKIKLTSLCVEHTYITCLIVSSDYQFEFKVTKLNNLKKKLKFIE